MFGDKFKRKYALSNQGAAKRVMQRVPNLNLSPFIGGASLISFRGVTTSPGTSTSPIVMYVDGVPVDTYFNLERSFAQTPAFATPRHGRSVATDVTQ